MTNDELNSIIRDVWRAGRKIDNINTYKSFEAAINLALLEGWDAEHDDDIDYTYALLEGEHE